MGVPIIRVRIDAQVSNSCNAAKSSRLNQNDSLICKHSELSDKPSMLAVGTARKAWEMSLLPDSFNP